MKHFIGLLFASVVFMFSFSLPAFSQIGACVRTIDEQAFDTKLDMYANRTERLQSVQDLKKTTLLVVIDSEESVLGKVYKSAFEKYWKFTPYKFIKTSEVVSYSSKPAYSLFIFLLIEYDTKEVPLTSGGGGPTPGFNSVGQSTLVSHPGTFGGLGYIMKWAKYHYQPYYQPEDIYFTNYRYAILLSDGKGYDYYNDDELVNTLKTVDYCWEYGRGGGPPPLSKPKSDTSSKGHPVILNQVIYKTITGVATGNTIWNEQQNTINTLPAYVRDMETDMEYIYQYKEEPVPRFNKFSCTFLYNNDKVKYTGGYYSYVDIKKNIKGKKLLLNNSFTDELSKQLICKAIDIDPTQAQLVPKSIIDSIIKTKDDNYLIFTDNTLDQDIEYRISLASGQQFFGISSELEMHKSGHYSYVDFYNKNKFTQEERAKYQIK